MLKSSGNLQHMLTLVLPRRVLFVATERRNQQFSGRHRAPEAPQSSFLGAALLWRALDHDGHDSRLMADSIPTAPYFAEECP